MNRKRYIALAIILLLVLTLFGCGMKTQQERAVEAMLADYTDYYIEIRNLRQQLYKQARTLTGYEDTAEYTFDVQIPDYSLIDINQVSFEVPAVDFENASGESYLAEYRKAIGLGLQQYAINNTVNGTVDATLTVRLTRSGDNEWTASPDRSSLATLEATISSMLEKKAAEITTLPKEYYFACIAEQKSTYVNSLIGEGAYADAVKVTNVEDIGNSQYRVSLSYPDPAAAFTTLGDAFVESITERIFGSITCELNPAEFDPSIGVATSNGSITVSVDESGTCTVADGTAFVDEFNGALTAAQDAAAAKAFDQWGVPEVTRPSTSQIISGSAVGTSSLEFRMGNALPDTYFRIYRVNSSVSEDGTFVVSYYAKSGSRYSVSLAPGNYKVLLAWGDSWYGADYMFGPDGKYYYFDFVVDVSGAGIYYTISHVWSWYSDVLGMEYGVDLTV